MFFENRVDVDLEPVLRPMTPGRVWTAQEDHQIRIDPSDGAAAFVVPTSDRVRQLERTVAAAAESAPKGFLTATLSVGISPIPSGHRATMHCHNDGTCAFRREP
jgi:hypothetical protein